MAAIRLLDVFRTRTSSVFQNLSFGRGLALAFMIGFFVRLLPEVLSFPYPIGFDTIYYAWRIESGVVLYHWSQLFSSWWLLFALLVPVRQTLQVDVFLLLKLTAPLLFGLNTCGIYYFASKALSWTARKAMFAAVFFAFQIAALGISWHFYRNMLGLGILLFALPWIKSSVKNVREFAVFALLSVFVVFSHEFGAVILFVVVLRFSLSSVVKGARRDSLKVLMAASLALAVFLPDVYFFVFPVQDIPGAQPNVVSVYQPSGHYQGPFFFFTNYLTVRDTVQHYPTYPNLVSHILSLFALLYIVIFPLILVGLFRHRILDWWTILLLIGSFGALVTPFFALEMWSRWMLMLVYPFTFYAVNGIGKILKSGGHSASTALRRVNWMRLSRRSVSLILVLSFSIGLVFMSTPLISGRAGVFGLPTTVFYVPSTMQSNSLPLVDVDGTVGAMNWLNAQMDRESVLLAQDAFFHWASLYLDKAHTLIYFKHNLNSAIEAAVEQRFDRLYFVWWNEDIGWYSLKVPETFAPVYGADRISVFEYHGEMVC